MSYKLIIDELKKLSLALQKIKDWDDDKFIIWANETKIYILGLLSDQEFKDLKKEAVKELEKYVKEISVYDVAKDGKKPHKKVNKIKNKFKSIIEPLIKVLEIKERSLSNNRIEWIDIIRSDPSSSKNRE